MSNTNYRRVALSEAPETDENGVPPGRGRSDRRISVSDRVHDKIAAFVWVLAALVVGYFSKSGHVLFDADSKANRPLLQLSAVCVGVDVCLLLYLTIYLPRCKGLTDSSAWEFYCPRVIPAMIATALTSFLLLVRATWPVWGCLSPLILGIETLGALFSLHFVPWPC
jgi:hypothetical protein